MQLRGDDMDNATMKLLVEAVTIVRDKLNELPDTPPGIADHLRGLGIKGETGCSTKCPIFRYFNNALEDAGLDVDVAVFTDNVILDSDEFGLHVNLPGPVQDFISQHDCDQYPDLVPDDEIIAATGAV